jgi:hypothetical protein
MPMTSRHSTTEIGSIVIPTCNRVDVLKRCLISYIENSKHYSRSNRFVVSDDSRSGETRAGYRQMLGGLSREYGVEIQYAGMEEKLRYARRLMQEQAAPPAVIKFALFDSEKLQLKTYGANRNALLLQTAGDTVLSVDDDTVCRIVASPRYNGRIRFISEQSFAVSDVWEMWILQDRESLLEFCDYVDQDILSLHEQVLGRKIDCFNFHAASEFETGMAKDSGRVLVTFNGVAGDSGWGSPFVYLLLTGDSWKRLTESLPVYQASCLSREILRVADCITVSSRTFESPAHAYGLDNREGLPPYFPVGGSEEFIHWATLSKCCNGYVAQLPWALLHTPIEDRLYAAGEVVKGTSGVMISSVIRAVIGAFEGGDNDKKLPALGEYLVNLANQPGKDFQHVVNTELQRNGHSLISYLEDRLKITDASPAFWANDVKRCIQNIYQSLSRTETSIPLNLLHTRSVNEAREMTQRLVLNFGQLLRHWPQMIEAARKLKLEEFTLAQPV